MPDDGPLRPSSPTAMHALDVEWYRPDPRRRLLPYWLGGGALVAAGRASLAARSSTRRRGPWAVGLERAALAERLRAAHRRTLDGAPAPSTNCPGGPP